MTRRGWWFVAAYAAILGAVFAGCVEALGWVDGLLYLGAFFAICLAATAWITRDEDLYNPPAAPWEDDDRGSA